MKISINSTEVRNNNVVSDRKTLATAEFKYVEGDDQRIQVQDYPIPGLGRDVRLNATIEMPGGNLSVKLTLGESTLTGANVLFLAMCNYGGVCPYFLATEGPHILELFFEE